MSAPRSFSDSNGYTSIINCLENQKVEYRPIEACSWHREMQDVVDELAGGDNTEGSCSSLAFAYAGNKAGYMVLDFRGGASCEYFSQNASIETVANLPGVDSKIIYGTDDIKCSNDLLSAIETGKEYYFAAGLHASIVRKTNSGYEYLELQHPIN